MYALANHLEEQSIFWPKRAEEVLILFYNSNQASTLHRLICNCRSASDMVSHVQILTYKIQNISTQASINNPKVKCSSKS